MSQSVRQSNLFAGEDFTKVYQSFKNVNFQAYDYDTIRNALIEYVKTFYPEDFNDYVESSEFIAVIELLAYLGTSLSFRIDLNSRENFLDTAERRESIIRLARMLSYQPRRNLASQGLLKITGAKTTERVLDSLGRNLADTTVVWNDPNNDDAYEQFVAILNSAFASSNTFGRPFKSGTVSNIATSLYKLNSVPFDTSIAFNLSALSNGQTFPMDIVNVDFNDGGTFFERHPNPESPFHVVYRNDGNGLASTDTGFFTYFKQGTLISQDFNFAEPIENRTQILDGTNINDQDVYVQKIQEDGTVLEEWTSVPSVVGSNIAYNDIGIDTRSIYSEITELDDTVTIKFSDGNFGEVPRDLFRIWYRTSANQKVVFNPDEFTVKTFDIPYTGNDGRQYVLTLQAELTQTISNGEPTETNEDIKENAPQVFYTQNRMVNNEDYNTFPLTRGNEIVKLRAINRTHSGHSRYIDVNDPTGVYSSLLINADDGALYKELDESRSVIEQKSGTTTNDILNFIQTQLNDQNLEQFFYDEYIRVADPLTLIAREDNYEWSQQVVNTSVEKGETGSIVGTNVSPLLPTKNNSQLPLLVGTRIQFVDPNTPGNFIWATIIEKTDDPADFNQHGPMILSDSVPYGYVVNNIIPFFRTTLSQFERDAIATDIELEVPFALTYDYEQDSWTTFLNPSSSDVFDNITDWLLYIEYNVNTGVSFPTFTSIARGAKYIFESAQEVRFFYDTDQTVFDVNSGRSLQDEIVIGGTSNTSGLTEVWEYTSDNVWTNGVIEYPFNYIVLATRDTQADDIDVQILQGAPAFGTATSGTLPISLASASGPFGDPGNDRLQITYLNGAPQQQDVRWNIKDKITLPDGYVDQRKVEVKPVDLNENGATEVPNSFDLIVNQEQDRVRFEKFTDFDGYEYFRIWQGNFVEGDTSSIVDDSGVLKFASEDISTVDLIVLLSDTISDFETDINAGTFFTDFEGTDGIIGTVITEKNSGAFYKLESNGLSFVLTLTTDYQEKIGRSFVNQRTGEAEALNYKWRHYAPSDVRIDPSISNIQDMLLMTRNYYNEVLVWKEENRALSLLPAEPTTQELRTQFSELDQFKMLSDQLIYKSGKFKVLFGPQADTELQARFKVVKLPNPVLSDNEIKSGVIQAIDRFFNIDNWDFGESFYYTELGAYIHQQLQNSVASVVIVPSDAESEFGNLFEIPSQPNELFISTARVDQVDIVRSLTETNLRVSK